MGHPGWVSVSMPYVAPRADGQPEPWGAEAARHGGVGTQRLLAVAEVVPPAEVAEALRVEDGATVVVRRRLMLLDDRPVELTDSYYPTTIARSTALAEHRKIRGGAVGLLTELGHRPRHACEDVCARRPTEEERAALALPAGDWVLTLTRLLSTASGQPIEVSMMTMLAEQRRLRYELMID
ncbi:GntR family transcriptional regulator [Micromonospora echinofusca]|uniref:UTRA domain-containing protein n=1 Tax=Micromonospora echinofusca TaxID=47858 RepID=A0ABS3VJN6_MICEH|nr:UTRA domain-containing protein [Micromonospora echinofusca]MBO4204732.1 UTRA domain-containing protein [Micromonospora echinofusca]